MLNVPIRKRVTRAEELIDLPPVTRGDGEKEHSLTEKKTLRTSRRSPERI